MHLDRFLHGGRSARHRPGPSPEKSAETPALSSPLQKSACDSLGQGFSENLRSSPDRILQVKYGWERSSIWCQIYFSPLLTCE